MKKVLFILALACVALTVRAQKTETRSIGSFSGVMATEAVDVYLKKGSKESARVEVTGANPSDVITEVSGSYLKIHMRHGHWSRVSAKVYVTYVAVNKLSASSAGNIYSDETIKANSMEITSSSAGTIEVTIDANNVDASVSSAADLELKGKTKSLTVDASSAGEVDAYELEAENVEAEASSSGYIKINVTKSLEARASSGGDIRYRGNPDKNSTQSSSGGSVKKST